MSSSENVFTILELSNSSQLPSNLYQPRSTFFNRKQTPSTVQQLLLRRNRLSSLSIYAKSIAQFKQHLTELSLRENLFTEFPLEITILKNLTTLSLANNQIEKIPDNTLSELPHLLWLNMSHNRLSELPVDIICCHHLRGLDVESNRFTSFPRVVCYLAHLEVLLMQKNKIKCIPPNLDFPPTLSTLNLAFNQLSQIPTTLVHNPPKSLSYLHLSGNKLCLLSPHFLSTGYQNLVSLDLHTCHLTHCPSVFFQRLAECKQLKRLNLAINRLTTLPSDIGLVTQLQWLNLNDNKLSKLPSSMGNLVHLVKLGLVQNNLTTLPPFLFSHMLELQKLDIRRNHLRFMPPSVLALSPRQEVDVHMDLAVPYNVFDTLSSPSCPRDKSCASHHPYGGSLRTLLFYENPSMEHVDGILFGMQSEQAQAISIAHAYGVLQTTCQKSALFQALSTSNTVYCSNYKFKQPESPTLLTDIDDDHGDDDGSNSNGDPHTAKVMSLKELSLRQYLSLSFADCLEQRLDQREEHRHLFLHEVLPENCLPGLLHQEVVRAAVQCDYCLSWYTESTYQVGYLTRMCNNRVQIPIRFQICSLNCAVDAILRLYKETVDWNTKQSLAHIDVALSMNRYWGTVGLAETNHEEEEAVASPSSSASSDSSSDSPSSPYASFGALLRNRISRFASSFFNMNANPNQETEESNETQPQRANLHVFRDNSQMIPLVYPNLNLGTTTPFPAQPRDGEPMSVTSRLVEGRLQTERPQLRLTTPTPNPAVFNHLPRDALRLERF